MKLLLLLGFLVFPALSTGMLPVFCIFNPIQLEAGVSLISARITHPPADRCTASIIFGDSDYPPITFHFNLIHCIGSQIASFPIPIGCPTGEAYITWHCAGESPSCNRVFISGGQSDLDPPLPHEEKVICEAESSASMTPPTTPALCSTFATLLATNAPVVTMVTKTIFDVATEVLTVSPDGMTPKPGSSCSTRGPFTRTFHFPNTTISNSLSVPPGRPQSTLGTVTKKGGEATQLASVVSAASTTRALMAATVLSTITITVFISAFIYG